MYASRDVSGHAYMYMYMYMHLTCNFSRQTVRYVFQGSGWGDHTCSKKTKKASNRCSTQLFVHALVDVDISSLAIISKHSKSPSFLPRSTFFVIRSSSSNPRGKNDHITAQQSRNIVHQPFLRSLPLTHVYTRYTQIIISTNSETTSSPQPIHPTPPHQARTHANGNDDDHSTTFKRQTSSTKKRLRTNALRPASLEKETTI
jgi:hypothetical protein